MPEVPPVGDFLPGDQAVGWQGLGAPRRPRSSSYQSRDGAGLADPKLKARLADLGNVGLTLSPAAFRKVIAADTEKWGKVVKFAG